MNSSSRSKRSHHGSSGSADGLLEAKQRCASRIGGANTIEARAQIAPGFIPSGAVLTGNVTIAQRVCVFQRSFEQGGELVDLRPLLGEAGIYSREDKSNAIRRRIFRSNS